jgi:hypothetical protein
LITQTATCHGAIGSGQTMPLLVVVLLDGRGDDAADADAVAAHDMVRLAVLVEHGGAHRLGVLRPSWKTWPTSMPRAMRACPAVGRGVALDDVADVGDRSARAGRGPS